MPGLLSLSQSAISNLGKASSIAAIYEYDKNGNLGSSGFQFQYFPETITDTKAVNYQVRDIPGGSLPLYQWISSGERVISFMAYFTSDVDLAAAGSSKLTASPPSNFKDLRAQGLANRNVDVRSALVALRRYLFPTYQPSGATPGTPLAVSPTTLNLMFTGTGLGLLGGISGSEPETQAVIDTVTCVMTQCDITIEALFPSGLIRVASVQLAFAQIAQLGGQVAFPTFADSQGIDWSHDIVDDGINDLVAPYPLKVDWK